MADVQDKNRSSSDEEPDYMSEEFLQQCTSNDVRPSLLHSRNEKRKHDALKRQLEQNKTKKEKDKDMFKSVEDGLKVPISEDNKGFKMLQKMGWSGSSIGKQKGITTPIGIELKHGRGGLGREQHELEKHQHKLSLGDPEKYRARQQNAALARENFLDLKKAQFACQSLDEVFGQIQPLEIWYWPKIKKTKKDVHAESDEEDDSVPGPMKRPRVDERDSDSSSSEEEDEDHENIPDEEKLTTVANYLRTQYQYCLWCATRYENNTDMLTSCPGEAKDDH